LSSHREVVVEHVEALRAVVGDNAGAMSVVNDVVLNEPVMAVMDGDSPLRSAVDSVADQRELVSVCRGLFGSEVVMEMDRITSDLVGSQMLDVALRSEEHTSELQSRVDVVCR